MRRRTLLRLKADPLARHVTAADYGDRWPLTVESGWLRYDPTTEGVRFTTEDGATFGVNGLAVDLNGDIPVVAIQKPRHDLPPVPGDDGTVQPVHRSVKPLIDDAPGRRKP